MFSLYIFIFFCHLFLLSPSKLPITYIFGYLKLLQSLMMLCPFLAFFSVFHSGSYLLSCFGFHLYILLLLTLLQTSPLFTYCIFPSEMPNLSLIKVYFQSHTLYFSSLQFQFGVLQIHTLFSCFLLNVSSTYSNIWDKVILIAFVYLSLFIICVFFCISFNQLGFSLLLNFIL